MSTSTTREQKAVALAATTRRLRRTATQVGYDVTDVIYDGTWHVETPAGPLDVIDRHGALIYDERLPRVYGFLPA